MYYLSGYIPGDYWLSWVYIIRDDWSDRDYAFFTNTWVFHHWKAVIDRG